MAATVLKLVRVYNALLLQTKTALKLKYILIYRKLAMSRSSSTELILVFELFELVK